MLSLLSLSSAMHASIITIQLYVVVIILSSIQCKQIFTILHSYMPYILTLFNKCCGNITPVCQSTLVESSGPNYNNIRLCNVECHQGGISNTYVRIPVSSDVDPLHCKCIVYQHPVIAYQVLGLWTSCALNYATYQQTVIQDQS